MSSPGHFWVQPLGTGRQGPTQQPGEEGRVRRPSSGRLASWRGLRSLPTPTIRGFQLEKRLKEGRTRGPAGFLSLGTAGGGHMGKCAGKRETLPLVCRLEHPAVRGWDLLTLRLHLLCSTE